MADLAGNSSDTPVSVVLYVHNGESFLVAALDSILGQTHRNFELCVVDDGSTDETARILSRATEADDRVRVMRQDAKGRTRLHETFNTCLSMVNHDLVAIANADDIWRPDKLERQLTEFAKDPRLDVCYHEATFIDADDRVLHGGFRRYDSPYLTAPPRPWQFVAGNPIPNPTVMFRRAIVRRIGLQEVGDMHDHQFWFKATLAGCRFTGLPDRLIRYRLHEASHSTASSRRDVIRHAHERCSTMMVTRHGIDELVPELSLVNAEDADSYAWAYSRIASALWTDGAHDAAGTFWGSAMRYSDDPAILFGLGLTEKRRGAEREGARLLAVAASQGVGYAHVALAGAVDVDSIQPPIWHGRQPDIAALVQRTDCTGLDLERDLSPEPFDAILVVPAAATSSESVRDQLAKGITDIKHNDSGVRMVSLARGATDIKLLSAAYDKLLSEEPSIANRLHLEVDVIPSDQQESVVDAHRLDGVVVVT